MKVLFVVNNMHFPEAFGGVQSSTDFLIKALNKNNIKAELFCKLQGAGIFGIIARIKKKISPNSWVKDNGLSYDVYRTWDPIDDFDKFLEFSKPDVVIVQCMGTIPFVKVLKCKKIPHIVYFRNVEPEEMCGDIMELTGAKCISNSNFTRGFYLKNYGIDSIVIPPSIEVEKYKTNSTKEFVTFINPVKVKGVELALEIAGKCPDIPFLFVESWELKSEELNALNERIAALKNITFMRRTSDMKKIYGLSKILIAPSIWEEAWGRVASEAHCSGIPVLGTDRGGLPEAIGTGGIIFSKSEPAQSWCNQLNKLWHDQEYYNLMSSNALEYSKRNQLNPEKQFEILKDIILETVSGKL